MIQEHHARRLHWDLRLERDGVLVSWAVPKGLPSEPSVNHLAVHVEDHPLEYGSFEGTIPPGEYGAGTVEIWDKGTYGLERWSEREVKFHLHGSRVDARFVLFETRGDQWLLHREAPPSGGWEPLPDVIPPMLATAGDLPTDEEGWAFELKWDGIRALAFIEGGRLRLVSRNGRECTDAYPELAGLAAALGSRQVVLDGEVVAFDADGRPSFEALQPRVHLADAAEARRAARRDPVSYLVFDLLHLDGSSLLERPYAERRRLLEGLGLGGERWAVPAAHAGPGADLLEAARANGLEGVVAKRIDSRYRPGRRSRSWVKVKVTSTQEVVIGGWSPGKGARAGLGALLLGVPSPRGLEYVGKVGTGFTEATLAELTRRLEGLRRGWSPFASAVPAAEATRAVWVEPVLVGEVRYAEWTRAGRLRAPAWRGLRPDKTPAEVVREA